MKSRILLPAVLVIAAACGDGTHTVTPTATPTPTGTPRATVADPIAFVSGNISGDGNQVCANALVNPGGAAWFGSKTDGYASSQTGGITVTVTDNKYIAWTATSDFVVTAIVVKGGTNEYVYHYNGTVSSDDGLVSPLNSGGNVPDISHYVVCYQAKLGVKKTAATSFDRTWAWKIAKSVDKPSLTLQPSESYVVNYTVTVDSLQSTDSNFAVGGTITVHNNAPVAADVSSVTDALSNGTTVTVDCPGGLPASVPAGGDLQCTYTQALASNAALTNTATATSTTGGVLTGTGSAAVAFGAPTRKLDDCVDVTDTLGGALGTVCLGSRTFNYPYTVGPFGAPGTYTVGNTATATSNSSGTATSASATVTIEVSAAGCTLTQGYWKNHANPLQKRFDPTWNLLAGGLGGNTMFYYANQTWLGVFNTPPAGNAYYILADQFMAAKLNVAGGAGTTPAVASAMSAAETFFGTATNTPSVKWSNAQKTTLTGYAATLQSYNEGTTGPGHCSEQS